jgi:hypothetical protein
MQCVSLRLWAMFAIHMGPVHRPIRIRRVVFRHGASRDVSTSVHRCKALIVIRFDGPGRGGDGDKRSADMQF